MSGSASEFDTIAQKLMAIVRSKTSAPVALDSTFDSLGLDSLAMAELVFEVEAAFQVRSDDRLLDSHTLADVVRYLQSKIEAKQRG